MSVFSEEMLETSAIEQIVREALAYDLTALFDTALFDITAASSARPAGLFNGATSVTASAAATPNEAMLADLRALRSAVAVTGTPDANAACVYHQSAAGDRLSLRGAAVHQHRRDRLHAGW